MYISPFAAGVFATLGSVMFCLLCGRCFTRTMTNEGQTEGRQKALQGHTDDTQNGGTKTMTATELSNRRRTVEGRLRAFAGCEYITTKQLKDWFGVSYRTVQRYLDGVPRLTGGRYHVADVANHLVQAEASA